MSKLDNPKALFQATCSTNSEPYALQNIGDMMSPEFSENCIIIVDPGMPIHNKAYVIIDFNDELYFRLFILENDEKLLVRSEEEYTSPISKIFKVCEEYIVITENSIYIVSTEIPTKRIS